MALADDFARLVPGVTLNPGEVLVGQATDSSGQGGWFLSSTGGVFNYGDAPFSGSYGSLPAASQQGDRTFLSIIANPSGGYTLVSNRGETYNFGQNQSPTIGGPGSTQAPAAPAPGTAPTLPDARSIVQQQLDQLGLGDLTDWALKDYQTTGNIDQVLADLRQQPAYQARYPAMAELIKSGRAITEGQYQQLEQSYKQIYAAAGLPAGFYDQPDDFAQLIGNEVSPSEVQSRVQLATQAAYQSPPEVRNQLNQLYGYGAGDLTAIFLDENRALPLLQQQYLGAQIGTASTQTGYGALTADEATALAAQGVTQAQAQQGFNTLSSQQQLFNQLPGENDTGISREDQLGAAFYGNAQDQQEIANQTQKRKNVFAGNAGFAVGQKGVSGLAPAHP